MLQVYTCLSFPITGKGDRKDRALQENKDELAALIDTINSMSAIKTIMVGIIVLKEL